jgi:cysteine desulfurase
MIQHTRVHALSRAVMRIYLDHNATTPPAAPVVEVMAAVLRDEFGNASSVHYYGQRAKARLDDARAQVAALIGGEPAELVFTSGGTEADNLALRGVAESAGPRRHLVASAIEHEAVLTTLKALGRRDWRVTLLPVGGEGIVDPEALRAAITDQTALVSVMHANNEIGTIQPVAALADLAHERGALFHTDAVQSAGKIPVNVGALGVDLLTLSAHKFHGPQGAGALWVRRGLRLMSTMTGGKQERSRRAGTENLPALAGMGVAARLAREKLADEMPRLAGLRDRLEQGILTAVPGTVVNGQPDARVPNTTNISFEGVEAESLLIALDLEGIAVSTGSACSSGTLAPSHVLRAMGLGSHRAQSSLRFSLGGGTSQAEIDRVLSVLPGMVERLRSLSRAGRAVAGRRS